MAMPPNIQLGRICPSGVCWPQETAFREGGFPDAKPGATPRKYLWLWLAGAGARPRDVAPYPRLSLGWKFGPRCRMRSRALTLLGWLLRENFHRLAAPHELRDHRQADRCLRICPAFFIFSRNFSSAVRPVFTWRCFTIWSRWPGRTR